jgi:LPXTG-motif cell wall-anchored protein
MNSRRLTRTLAYSVLAMAVVLIVSAPAVIAQDTSQSTVTQGQPAQQVTVEHGEVVYVSGNDLVVKNLDTGELRNFIVPDSARVTVGGQELSVHDLKPGMKLQRTITTTTTPQVVTTVRTIQGTVWHVTAPISVILTLPDGTNKQYKIPKDQKFTVNGQEMDAFHLKKGMNVTATVISEVPETQVAEQRTVTGQMPPPPSPPPMQGALLIEEAPQPPPTIAEAKPSPPPSKLPQTGSMLPLLGLLGLLFSVTSLGMGIWRRF